MKFYFTRRLSDAFFQPLVGGKQLENQLLLNVR